MTLSAWLAESLMEIVTRKFKIVFMVAKEGKNLMVEKHTVDVGVRDRSREGKFMACNG